MRGTCANLGAVQAAATALELERAAAAGNFSRTQESLQLLEAQVQNARELLEEFKQECCDANPNRR